MVTPGVYEITNVPAGYYWLTMIFPAGLPPIGFWTSSSTFDLGRDVAGDVPAQTDGSQTATFAFSLSGLDPSLPPGAVSFAPDRFAAPPTYLTPQPGSSTLTATASVTGSIDWTKVDTAFLMQYEPVSLGALNNLVVGPELTLSNLALINGATNPITGTLAASPQVSLNLSIPGSQWSTLFENVGPSTVTPAASWLSIAAEPYVTGINVNRSPLGPNLYLVLPTLPSGLPPVGGMCPGIPFGFPDAGQIPVTTDENFGILQYGDPFPSAWTRALDFCQNANVPIAVGGVNVPTPINFGISVVPSNSPLAPLAAPVQDPTINGSSLFTTTTVNNAVETLSWTAPVGTLPYGYTVYVFKVTPIPNGADFSNIGTYGTAQTSITLPPLATGNTYLFVIVTQVDGAADMETKPYRSQLPDGFATVVSSPISVSAGATTPVLQGDSSVWKWLLHPDGAAHYRIPASR
jgi:hypothetical protein